MLKTITLALLLALSINGYALTDAELEKCAETSPEFKSAMINFGHFHQYMETIEVDHMNMASMLRHSGRRRLLTSNNCQEATTIIKDINDDLELLMNTIQRLID